MPKDKNATANQGPEKRTKREMAKKAARKTRDPDLRAKKVKALRTGSAQRKINKRLNDKKG